MRSWLTRSWWAPAGALLIALAVIAILVIRPGQRDIPPLRARPYNDHTACLLTDARGITGPEAAPVWAGMQDASTQTAVKVSYLAVVGPDTVADARTFVASLTQRHCELIVAIGKNQVDAASLEAAGHPDVTFAAFGSANNGGMLTISAVAPDAAKQSARKLITDLAGGQLVKAPNAPSVVPQAPAKTAW